MLRSLNEIIGYTLDAKNGDIGRCQDFLIDDEPWAIRYMVADTGTWLPERKVLVSPISVREPDWTSRTISLDLTKEQIEKSPALANDEPVSRQYEADWFFAHSYLPYWGGVGVWGAGDDPTKLTQMKEGQGPSAPKESGDPHLRSAKEITGYTIKATDGEIGHVEDLIVDDESWIVPFMIVDTRNWLPGRKVIVSTASIESLSWDDNQVRVGLSREMVKESPPYDPSQAINRKQETVLYDYYGRPKSRERATVAGPA